MHATSTRVQHVQYPWMPHIKDSYIRGEMWRLLESVKTWSETIYLPDVIDDIDWSDLDILITECSKLKENSRLLGSREPKSNN